MVAESASLGWQMTSFSWKHCIPPEILGLFQQAHSSLGNPSHGLDEFHDVTSVQEVVLELEIEFVHAIRTIGSFGQEEN